LTAELIEIITVDNKLDDIVSHFPSTHFA